MSNEPRCQVYRWDFSTTSIISFHQQPVEHSIWPVWLSFLPNFTSALQAFARYRFHINFIDELE
jgi:hypothetical protein